MKWTKRIHYYGAAYHAMALGVNGQDIFTDDADRAAFRKGLLNLARESGADLLAYCLMDDRFHIAIRVGTMPLATIMQRLLASYATAFNRRHSRTGHLFQARYRAVLCRDAEYLAALVRYIHMSPVRAALVGRAADWPWSSLGGGHLSDEDVADDDQFEPWPEAVPEDDGRIRHARIDPLDIGKIGEAVSARTGIDVLELRSNSCRRPVVAAKRLLAQEAVRRGHALLDIACWMNSSPASLTRYARTKVEIPVGLTPSKTEGA